MLWHIITAAACVDAKKDITEAKKCQFVLSFQLPLHFLAYFLTFF